MMKKIGTFMLVVASMFLMSATKMEAGYKLGDIVPDFSLKNIDGKMVSMTDYPNAEGFIVVFSCNHCPYVVAYEDRIIDLHNKYGKFFPVIAINSNDANAYPDDSFENMKKRAKDKKFPFVYLQDETQEVAKRFGATKTPHVYILKKQLTEYVVKYIGAIDNNYQDAAKADEKYVEDAIQALVSGGEPSPAETKAIGCSLKWKK